MFDIKAFKETFPPELLPKLSVYTMFTHECNVFGYNHIAWELYRKHHELYEERMDAVLRTGNAYRRRHDVIIERGRIIVTHEYLWRLCRRIYQCNIFDLDKMTDIMDRVKYILGKLFNANYHSNTKFFKEIKNLMNQLRKASYWSWFVNRVKDQHRVQVLVLHPGQPVRNWYKRPGQWMAQPDVKHPSHFNYKYICEDQDIARCALGTEYICETDDQNFIEFRDRRAILASVTGEAINLDPLGE